MDELPIFPLHTVLFPGQPLPLHIFEERYKQLIKDCLELDNSFGVVLIKSGVEAFGPIPEPHAIGCSARIIEIQPLSEGRMNIITLGENRIRIKAIQKSDPYLVGHVESYPLASANPAQFRQTSQHLIPRLKRYMGLLNQIEDGSIDPDKLPDDPVMLAYLAAVLLEVPLETKQDLLETEAVNELYEKLAVIYRLEISFLKAEIERGKQPNTSIITPN